MKEELFDKLVKSVAQAGKIKRGEKRAGRIFKYKVPNIKKIRSNLSVSQSEFANLIGVSLSTIQNWEQGRREPEGPAKVLLRVAQKNPQAIVNALHAV